MMRKPVLLACALTLVMAAPALAEPKDDAIQVMKAFGGALKSELETAMGAGGPVAAVGACNDKAPAIAAQHAQSSGWSVGRTSLKLRNQNNAPDAWESKVLAQFEERKAKGENPDAIAFGEMVEAGGKKTFRFMKAIPTGEVCLNCHGTEIKPEVSAKINAHYPADQARGFKLGDIRGAFTLEKAM